MSTSVSNQWRARRKQLTESILLLYTSSASPEQLNRAFQCFAPSVTFTDPIVDIKGIDQYEAQFRTLRKAFKHFRPVDVTITGDFDKIAIDLTVNWAGSWYSLNLRQTTICYIDQSGLGKITKHEDLWSFADFMLQLPLIRYFYGMWRPWFGNRSSQYFMNSAAKKGEDWVEPAKQRRHAREPELPTDQSFVQSKESDLEISDQAMFEDKDRLSDVSKRSSTYGKTSSTL